MRNLADMIKKARENAGLSRAELAHLLHVSERSIKNWEQALAKPDADTFLDLCFACNDRMAADMLKMQHPELFESDDIEMLRQLLITYIRSAASDRMIKMLIYNLMSAHGSDAEAQINLCTAYNHLTLEDKVDVCKLIMSKYRIREAQDRLVCPDDARPDLKYLRNAVELATAEIIKVK